jgi:hypothetical protein
MNSENNTVTKFFGVAIQGQTYRNLLYVLLAFPLGLFYFVFLVTGLSLGIGLAIILVGVFVLLAVLACWWAFAAFERQMAIGLLHENIPPMVKPETKGKNLFDQFVALFGNPVTWKSLAYLLIKFPLGLLSFVVSVTLISITVTLLAAPLTYRRFPLEIWYTWTNVWRMDTLEFAIVEFFIGVVLLFVSMHILNFIARVSGSFARVMLGSRSYANQSVGQAPVAIANEAALPAETLPATQEQNESSVLKPEQDQSMPDDGEPVI